jgi:hypothetical protein
MAFAALIAAALLAAAPPTHATPVLLLAQADADAPHVTGSTPEEDANAEALAAGEAPFPAGAPTDDYGLVAWCYGALSRHMELRINVWPEVERIEGEFPEPGVPLKDALASYDQQEKAGQAELDLYTRALNLAEVAHTEGTADRAAIVQKGRDAWTGADALSAKELGPQWMSWALPARCGQTARRMLGE